MSTFKKAVGFLGLFVVFCLWVGVRPSLAQQRKSDKDLETKFFTEYPQAALRLQAAIESLQGKAKYKLTKPSSPDERWIALDFYTSGPNLRLDQSYTPDDAAKAKGERPIHESLLMSQELTAEVAQPSTNDARLRRADNKPLPGQQLKAEIRFLRLLKGAYCNECAPILDKVKSGSWSVRSVLPSTDNPAWVVVEFAVSDPAAIIIPGQPNIKITGSTLVTFSPTEDWAVRRLQMEYNQPKRKRLDTVISEVMKVPSGHVPKSLRMVWLKPATGGGSWVEDEKCEYEMLEVSAGPIAASTFTLSALGIRFP
jgi:hypothetical protein